MGTRAFIQRYTASITAPQKTKTTEKVSIAHLVRSIYCKSVRVSADYTSLAYPNKYIPIGKFTFQGQSLEEVVLCKQHVVQKKTQW